MLLPTSASRSLIFQRLWVIDSISRVKGLALPRSCSPFYPKSKTPQPTHLSWYFVSNSLVTHLALAEVSKEPITLACKKALTSFSISVNTSRLLNFAHEKDTHMRIPLSEIKRPWPVRCPRGKAEPHRRLARPDRGPVPERYAHIRHINKGMPGVYRAFHSSPLSLRLLIELLRCHELAFPNDVIAGGIVGPGGPPAVA